MTNHKYFAIICFMSETVPVQEFYEQRSLLVGRGMHSNLAAAAIYSLGLRQLDPGVVPQTHPDGTPIDPDSGNVRVVWYPPVDRLLSADQKQLTPVESEFRAIDYEKGMISHRLSELNARYNAAADAGKALTMLELAANFYRPYPDQPVITPEEPQEPDESHAHPQAHAHSHSRAVVSATEEEA